LTVKASDRLAWVVDALEVAPADRILAALHKPGRALDVVRERLEPGGRLYLFSQAPSWREAGPAEQFGEELRAVLDGAGLVVERLLVKELESGFAAGVVARV
jgi:hypothetical protein